MGLLVLVLKGPREVKKAQNVLQGLNITPSYRWVFSIPMGLLVGRMARAAAHVLRYLKEKISCLFLFSPTGPSSLTHHDLFIPEYKFSFKPPYLAQKVSNNKVVNYSDECILYDIIFYAMVARLGLALFFELLACGQLLGPFRPTTATGQCCLKAKLQKT